MLLRFDEPGEEEILIDGTPISGVTLHSLRIQIGMVQHQVLLITRRPESLNWRIESSGSKMAD